LPANRAKESEESFAVFAREFEVLANELVDRDVVSERAQ
jgi:hypothetical protein